jgi:hypothetical protein
MRSRGSVAFRPLLLSSSTWVGMVRISRADAAGQAARIVAS